MTRSDLLHILEFLDEVEAIVEADDLGVTWDLEDRLKSVKQIIIEGISNETK